MVNHSPGIKLTTTLPAARPNFWRAMAASESARVYLPFIYGKDEAGRHAYSRNSNLTISSSGDLTPIAVRFVAGS